MGDLATHRLATFIASVGNHIMILVNNLAFLRGADDMSGTDNTRAIDQALFCGVTNAVRHTVGACHVTHCGEAAFQ